MSDETDPFAAARTRLQETVKWLAASLSGLGGALAAGIALTGIGKLEGEAFHAALIFGTFAIVGVVWALALLLSLLTLPPLAFSELLEDEELREILAEIERRPADILPATVRTVAELRGLRRVRRARIRRAWADYVAAEAAGASAARLAELQAAHEGHAQIAKMLDGGINRVVGYANLLRLHREVKRKMRGLMVLALVTFFCLAGVAYQIARAPEPATPGHALRIEWR